MKRPGPQSATWRAGYYALHKDANGRTSWQRLQVPKRPPGVPEWLIGFGIVLLLVAVAGVVVAIAVEAMQVHPK